MTDKKLQEALNKLNQALEDLDANDTDSKEKLSELILKINEKLAGSNGDGESNHLSGLLAESMMHFQAKHPLISEAINEMKVALYSLGL